MGPCLVSWGPHLLCWSVQPDGDCPIVPVGVWVIQAQKKHRTCNVTSSGRKNQKLVVKEREVATADPPCRFPSGASCVARGPGGGPCVSYSGASSTTVVSLQFVRFAHTEGAKRSHHHSVYFVLCDSCSSLSKANHSWHRCPSWGCATHIAARYRQCHCLVSC